MIIKLLAPLKVRLNISDIKNQPWSQLTDKSPTDKNEPEQTVS